MTIGTLARLAFVIITVILAFVFDKFRKLCKVYSLGWTICGFCALFCTAVSIGMFMLCVVLLGAWACTI